MELRLADLAQRTKNLESADDLRVFLNDLAALAEWAEQGNDPEHEFQNLTLSTFLSAIAYHVERYEEWYKLHGIDIGNLSPFALVADALIAGAVLD
jgi:hypothetical protein